MLVKFNSENGGINIIPYSVRKGSGIDPSSVAGKAIIFAPGWNEVPTDDWQFVEDTLEVGIESGKYELQCKETEIEEEVNGEKIVKKVRIQQKLGDVRADMARKIVEGCYNPKVLERWQVDTKISSELRALADICLQKIAAVGNEP